MTGAPDGQFRCHRIALLVVGRHAVDVGLRRGVHRRDDAAAHETRRFDADWYIVCREMNMRVDEAAEPNHLRSLSALHINETAAKDEAIPSARLCFVERTVGALEEVLEAG